MITAIRDIGEWIQRHQQKDALDVLIEPINPNNYRYAILLSIKGNEWNIELEENDPNTSSRYLYRKGSPNGINYSPTSMITELEKTFNIKFVAWFKKALEERKSENIKIESLIRPICELLDQEGEAILAKISDILKGIKDGAFLSLKIDGKYLKEIPQFVNLFLEMVNEKDMEISSYNQVCSVCGKQRELVVGGSSAFAFYTIDKPGFISGNFNANLSWRNHPVCMECNLLLQEGKRFVEENLRFSFYGLNYLLIPQFMYGKLELKDSIMRILEDEKKNKRLDSITINNTIASEEDILHYLKDESDQLVVHLLFMKKMNSAERILLLIQDVYPSHLRKIFEAKGHVEEQFTKYDGSIERYHFGRIRTFFQKSDEGKTSTDLDKYFLEIISAVFRGMKIDINFLITFFMKVIRSKYLSSKENDWEFQVSIRDALMNLLFFMRLGILRVKEEESVSSSRFDLIYERLVPHLDRPEKKGLFLLGVLTQLLLDVQKEIRQAQPFRDKLKGLRMREGEFKGLVPLIKDKLWQYESDLRYKDYDRFYAAVLFEEISTLLELSGDNWKLSVDEMNFHFVSGMSMKFKVLNLLNELKSK